MKSSIFYITLFIAFGGQCQVLTDIPDQKQIWYAFNSTIHFNKKIGGGFELHERHFLQPAAQSQFAIRGRFIYKLNDDWSIAPSFCFFTNRTSAIIDDKSMAGEMRPYIEFNGRQKIKKLTIEHRYIAEARFFDQTLGGSSDYQFSNFRLRYRLQFIIPVHHFGKENNREVKLKLNHEIFLNTGGNTTTNYIDHYRIYAGFMTDLSDHWKFEIGYLNSSLPQTQTAESFHRHIARVTLLHEISLTDLKKRRGE